MIGVDELLELLVCPVCGGSLARGGAGEPRLECVGCGAEYPFHLDIPILLAPELRAGSHTPKTALTHKERQVAFFDQDPADDFGITRPRGAPPLYGWLLQEKFRRSVIGLEQLLPGATALTVCGGSGVDAEFLSRAGARVILSDISLGVVLQTRERATRYGLDLALVVADAEALPFRDEALDLVYVHDGLHHLERPVLGLAEMARVARRAVSITEPAAALLTNAAVRLGLAEAQARAGQYDQAINAFKELAQRKDGPLPVDGILMQLGRTYRDAGKRSDAQQTFNRIVEEYPDSAFSGDAKKELDALKKT